MGHLPSLVPPGSGSLDSASVRDARIALCSLMGGGGSHHHLIQAIRWPAPEILARSRDRAERPQGRAAPAMPVWAMLRSDFLVVTRPRAWGWVTSRWPWLPALAWRPRLLARA